MNQGSIITFYSYKGGVGRTMALANIATILAQWGKKVLVIDWDLEAPGLERYFVNYVNNSRLGNKKGVVDLMANKTSRKKQNWKDCIQNIKIGNKYELKYLGSGKRGNNYYNKLRQLDIDDLYEQNNGFGFLESLRREWKSEFEYILIDSRTGITDNGGICTIQLPDIVLVFTNTNEQGVIGTNEVIKRISSSQQSQPYDRQNLIIFPILCRFDTTTEFEISQAWIKKVSDNFKDAYNGWLPLTVNIKEFIEKTKIPYFPYFSFGEKLAVIDQGPSDPSSMGYAYESLSSIVLNNFENIDEFINNRSSYINRAKKSTHYIAPFKVFGVGGGGCNAVNLMNKTGIKGVDYYVCNTDSQSLENSLVVNKIQLGVNITEGKGAGSIPDIGRKAAIESIEKIRETLKENTKILIITAGMGGGTGTGASPIIAKAAKEMGILTIGVVTTPFAFEGRKRRQQAEKGLIAMKSSTDTLLVICIDYFRELYGDLSVSDAFEKADFVITTAVKEISELLTLSGSKNVDVDYLKKTLKKSGFAILGLGVGAGEDRAVIAVEKAVKSQLFNKETIKEARTILLSIRSGAEKKITMDEVTVITDYIQNMSDVVLEIIWGIGINKDIKSNISITIVATNFNTNTQVLLDSCFRSPTDFDLVKEHADFDSTNTERLNRLKDLSLQLKSPSGLDDLQKAPSFLERKNEFGDKKNKNKETKSPKVAAKVKRVQRGQKKNSK